MKTGLILLTISAIVSAVSQILLKKSATIEHESRIKEYLNIWVLLGYVLLFATTIINLFAYRKIDYKYGPVMESMAFVFVVLMSFTFFKEKLTKRKVLGSLLVVLGIIVFNL